MTLAGPSYKCIGADVQTNGRINDGVVQNKNGFTHVAKTIKISQTTFRFLTESVQNISFLFIGDDAFALKPYLLKLNHSKTYQRATIHRHFKAQKGFW